LENCKKERKLELEIEIEFWRILEIRIESED